MNASIPSPVKVRSSASGLHLFDRRSGVNLLFESFRPDPLTWAKAPRHIAIALTNACELSCDFCFAPKSNASLSLKALQGWLLELDKNGAIGIGLGGGEPTLHPEFTEVCRFATRQTGLAVSFTTHGHRIDSELASALTGNVNFIRVSMDGINSVYEAHRCRSFKGFLEHLALIRAIAPFGINYVVNRKTLPQLSDAVELAARLGAREFLLLPQQPVHGIAGIDIVSKTRLSAWVDAYRGPLSLAVSELGAEGLPTCDPFPNEDQLTGFAHIDAFGVLKKCGYARDGIQIGPMGIMDALTQLRQAGGER